MSESRFKSMPEALHADGTIYHHWKGGVYRVLGHREEDDVILYEHLWPHAHDLYERPASEFRDSVNRPEEFYSGPRFTFVKGTPV